MIYTINYKSKIKNKYSFKNIGHIKSIGSVIDKEKKYGIVDKRIQTK